MSTTLPTPATRQATIIAAIAVLHAGAFVAASTGFRIPVGMPQLPMQEIFVTPAPARPATGSRPEPVAPGDYQPEPVETPKLVFTSEDRAGFDAVSAAPTSLAGGEGAPVVLAGDRGPAIGTRDARLQALVNRCYPASARRRGQEGRGVVRVVVEASGRASASGRRNEHGVGGPGRRDGVRCALDRFRAGPSRRPSRAGAGAHADRIPAALSRPRDGGV